MGEVAVGSELEPTPANRWIAESEDGVVGAVERTSRGKYRATDSSGRKVGTFRTLTEARRQLAEKYDSTASQRMDQSRTLLITGLIVLIATTVIAIVGVVLLLL